MSHLEPFGTVWDCLGPFRTVWDNLRLLGAVLDRSGPLWTVREHLGTFGTVLDYSCYGNYGTTRKIFSEVLGGRREGGGGRKGRGGILEESLHLLPCQVRGGNKGRKGI